MGVRARVTALLVLVLLLGACAGYTSTQAALCAQAVATTLRGVAATVLDCRDADRTQSTDDVLQCVDDTLATVAGSAAAYPACAPPPAPPPAP